MGKRYSRGDGGNGNAGASRKRAKIVHEAPTFEEVYTSRQLKALLAFDQDVARARHGTFNIPSRCFGVCVLVKEC